MRISGIITEYNPFHNGHKYQINRVRENADGVVCVMSGSFVQRGDVAVFDKWTRTKAALLNGADLVIELPVVYAASTAERFAFGAVSLMTSLGVVEELCFGSESGKLAELMQAAQYINCEPQDVSKKIKELLLTGKSYPAARQEAYSGLIDAAVLNNPNNILAVEYIRAIIAQKSHVKPITIQRIGSGYHEKEVHDSYASATALRIKMSKQEDCSSLVPKNVEEMYKASEFYSISELNSTFLYLLRCTEPEKIALINDVSEGLEYRLKENAMRCSTIEEVINQTVTKRYIRTKIQRILISLLLSIDKNIIQEKASYIRVLGFNDMGRKIISEIKKKSDLPIITKTADFKENSKMFRKDLLATDLAALCSSDPKKKTGGKDFTTSPVYLSE